MMPSPRRLPHTISPVEEANSNLYGAFAAARLKNEERPFRSEQRTGNKPKTTT
jgi:hypothetical protein